VISPGPSRVGRPRRTRDPRAVEQVGVRGIAPHDVLHDVPNAAMLIHSETRRLRLDVQGVVQGVGFRPFVYRLATELSVRGWIVNDPGGVRIEVEGDATVVARFAERLQAELPPRAAIHTVREAWLPPAGDERFEIRASGADGPRTAVVLPDIATCDACLDEVLDPDDRRYCYPFANCTDCGPRFSIVRALPYDRPNTTMAGFTMCALCAAEYADPHDRRFHAQPNACPECGPRLELRDIEGNPLPVKTGGELRTAARALRQGRILAVKGIGGFHLMVDAANGDAVARLRARKHRPAKPLALMAPSLDAARGICEIDDAEAALLASAEAPIVLLRRRDGAAVAADVAPASHRLGVMLPCTPLHHLLLREYGAPIVATSGNLSEEPICTDEAEAIERLGGIADLFLVHDRPIERHMDDSVAWTIDDAPQLLRRARGYAPLPVRLAASVPTILAVGAHLKNTVALGVGDRVVVSQHIGDLDAPESQAAFERVIRDLLRLHEAQPVAIAHDLHPDYSSTAWARLSPGLPRGIRRIGVQHHHAHLASCLAENGASGSALGIVWDGTGYGAVDAVDAVGDGTVWGGEFLLGDAARFERVAHLLPFRLPGGEAAIREPRRAALGLLWELLGTVALEQEDIAAVRSFSLGERRVLGSVLEAGALSPVTTSMGRLFDAVAALLGLCQAARFEGEAAMRLEWVADPAERGAYSFPLLDPERPGAPRRLDWRSTVEEVVLDLRRGATAGKVAARFHNALVAAAKEVARAVGNEQVALTGGCFQNRILAERTAAALRDAGFRVLVHRQVPPNDGGISLGQVAVAAARLVPTPA
jgi:hydrogenase maturation protein HypF